MRNSTVTIQELDIISLESISGGHKNNHRHHSHSPMLPHSNNGQKGNVTFNILFNITVINIVSSSIEGPLTITTLQQNVV